MLERVSPLLVGIVHVALVLSRLGIRGFASRPIANGDYAAHYYAAFHAAEHLRESRALWGYDPWWMAGYPEGLVSLVDDKLFLVLLAAVPASGRPLVFNAVIALILLAVPACGYWAGRLGGARRSEATLVAIGGMIVTFTVPVAVFFWVGGAISFFLVSYLVVPIALGLVSEMRSARAAATRWGGRVGATAALIAVHPAILPTLGAALTPLLPTLRGLRPLDGVKLVALVVAVALPLWWPVVALAYVARSGTVVSVGPWMTTQFLQGGVGRLFDDWVRHFFHTNPGWNGGAGGLVALAILAGASLTRRPEAERSARVAAWSAIAFCFVLGYATSRIDVMRFIQPYRFVIPLGFFLCLPAARGAIVGLEALRRRSPVAVIGALVVVGLVGQSFHAARGAALGHGVDDAETEVIDFFSQREDDGGRLLVESDWTTLPAFSRSSSPMTFKRFALLPLKLRRECLGYEGTGALTPHRYASFAFKRLLGLDLTRATEDEVAEVLARYAVSWIVACSGEARSGLGRLADVARHERNVADCELFRVMRPSVSRVLEGSARVEADIDRIEVHEARGDSLVLKYHWVRGLRTIPPLPIEERRIAPAPVGFIRVRPEGRSEFSIVW
jgi:MFS family permease